MDNCSAYRAPRNKQWPVLINDPIRLPTTEYIVSLFRDCTCRWTHCPCNSLIEHPISEELEKWPHKPREVSASRTRPRSKDSGCWNSRQSCLSCFRQRTRLRRFPLFIFPPCHNRSVKIYIPYYAPGLFRWLDERVEFLDLHAYFSRHSSRKYTVQWLMYYIS